MAKFVNDYFEEIQELVVTRNDLMNKLFKHNSDVLEFLENNEELSDREKSFLANQLSI